MPRSAVTFVAAVLLVLPLAAGAVIESKTGTVYPDEVMVESGADMITLVATGAALREKTIMKVDVYTIASYVAAGAELGDDPAEALRTLDVPKRLQMDLRRGFGRDKLIDSFREVIGKNYDDTSAFDADMAVFFAYFDRDAQDKDQIVFDYVPGTGLVTSLNGERKGVIANPAFVTALWTVWFGEKPADHGMQKALVSAI